MPQSSAATFASNDGEIASPMRLQSIRCCSEAHLVPSIVLDCFLMKEPVAVVRRAMQKLCVEIFRLKADWMAKNGQFVMKLIGTSTATHDQPANWLSVIGDTITDGRKQATKIG